MRSLPNQIDVTTFPTNKQPSSHVTDEWKKNSSKTRESIDAACEPRARRCLQIYIKDCLRARCDISGNTCCSFLLTKDWCFHFPFNETYIHSWIAEKSSRHRARLPRRTIRQAFNNKRERTRKRLTSHADENPAFQQARSPQPRVLSNFFALRSPVYDFPVMSRRSRAFASPQSLLTTDRTTRHSVPLFLCLFSFPSSHSLSLSLSAVFQPLDKSSTTYSRFVYNRGSTDCFTPHDHEKVEHLRIVGSHDFTWPSFSRGWRRDALEKYGRRRATCFARRVSSPRPSEYETTRRLAKCE